MTALLFGAAIYLVALAKWPGAIAVCVLAAVALNRLGRTGLVIAAFSVAFAGWIALAVPATVPGEAHQHQQWHLTVASTPQQRADGWDFTARTLDGLAADLSVLVHSSDPTPPTIGSHIYLRGTIVARTPGDSSLDYLTGIGVSGEIYTREVIIETEGTGPIAWLNRFRFDTVRGIQHAVPGDAGALLAGFVTGDDGRLSAGSDDEFRAAGLSHLTAVSGSNLAMLLTMIGIVSHATGRRRNSIMIAGVMLLWAYALFVGLPPPTLRAALLATVAAGGRSIGRPVDIVTLTLLTVPIQIAMRPEDAWSVSFHLSVAASFGLAAGFSRYPLQERRHGLAELLTATAFAQLATFPLIVGVFGSAPVFSLFANIAAIPFASFAFGVAMIGSGGLAIWTPLGTSMLIPAGWAADVVLRIANLYGRAWSRFETGSLGDPWIIGLTLVALILLLAVSGELRSIRRQLRANPGISAQNG